MGMFLNPPQEGARDREMQRVRHRAGRESWKQEQGGNCGREEKGREEREKQKSGKKGWREERRKEGVGGWEGRGDGGRLESRLEGRGGRRAEQEGSEDARFTAKPL